MITTVSQFIGHWMTEKCQSEYSRGFPIDGFEVREEIGRMHREYRSDPMGFSVKYGANFDLIDDTDQYVIKGPPF